MPGATRPAEVAAPYPALLLPGVIAEPRSFSAIEGWASDDHGAAFAAFLETCAPIVDGRAALREAQPPPAQLVENCRRALSAGPLNSRDARAFFEARFAAIEIRPAGGQGFLTAYYEPEVPAALEPGPAFSVPVLARPRDLVTLKPGEAVPGLDPALQGARRTGAGLAAFPDRAAIWAGALDGQGLEIAWLRDHAELFIIQVQGSARLLLPDGRRMRLTYAGRNGHPYSSIGRRLVERGEIRLEDMSLARLMDWLRAEPARGRALMEENQSYVFFALSAATAQERGPIGGAGTPLSPERSLAIDRTLWPYGLPVFVDLTPLVPHGGRERIARLMIAQDTGSAIIGPARGDYFMGSGAAAGTRAGLVRDPARFIVLVPRSQP